MPQDTPHSTSSASGATSVASTTAASTTTASTTAASTGSRLLDLPPELRDVVWTYALTNPDPVWVTEELKEPPLLQVNRQVRSETRKLALLANDFVIDVDSCDARLFSKFIQLRQRMVRTDTRFENLRPSMMVELGGECHWANLVEWCRLVHAGVCTPVLTGSTDLGGMGRVIEAATNMALHAKSWEEVERVYSCGGLLLGWLTKNGSLSLKCRSESYRCWKSANMTRNGAFERF